MRIRGVSTVSDLHTAIDAAWARKLLDEATCSECDGARLSEDGTICWDCQASDYLEEPCGSTNIGHDTSRKGGTS